jgi:hypothetical protein
MVRYNDIRLIEIVLTFISSLAWPIVVLYAVRLFQEQIAKMLLNMRSFKSPIGDFEFQQQDSDAQPLKEGATQEKYIDPRGFYTREGLSQLIAKSGSFQEGEKIVDMFLLFDTLRQHTWIISTNRKLFCVLDDENTRFNRRLIQWEMPLIEAEPIRVRTSAKGNPIVDIGQRRNWRYSRHLYPTEESILEKIKRLIETSKSQSNKS